MEYRGTIAGIGDKVYDEEGNFISDQSTNVIYPKFDASIRKFIVGKDCVVDGLTLTGTILSAGHCMAFGYVGELPESISFETQPKYIYGHFVVNHDKNVLDEFSIYTSDDEITEFQIVTQKNITVQNYSSPSKTVSLKVNYESWGINPRSEEDFSTLTFIASQGEYTESLDIAYRNLDKVNKTITIVLTSFSGIPMGARVRIDVNVKSYYNNELDKESGEYYLPLYEDGLRVIDNNYPQNSVHSDTSENLSDSGTIAATATVEGDIDVSDSSQKVATTKFVQDVMKKEIDKQMEQIDYYVFENKPLGQEDVKIKAGTLYIEKQIDFVICTAVGNDIEVEVSRLVGDYGVTIEIGGIKNEKLFPKWSTLVSLPLLPPTGKIIVHCELNENGIFGTDSRTEEQNVFSAKSVTTIWKSKKEIS